MGDAGEKRHAMFSNTRRSLGVCDRCNRTNPARAVYSACANSESQQPLRCAASPAGSGFANSGLFSRIIPRRHQSSGQSSTECFSLPAQATTSLRSRHPLSREVGRFRHETKNCSSRCRRRSRIGSHPGRTSQSPAEARGCGLRSRERSR